MRSTDDLSGGDGDSCDEAFIVDGVPFHVTGDSFDAGGLHSFGPDSCDGLMFGGGDGVEEVFSFTPETTAIYHIRVRTTIWLSVTYVVTDCADTDGTCMGGTNRTNDQWLDLELEAATTYYIIVDSTVTSGSGTYDLMITVS